MKVTLNYFCKPTKSNPDGNVFMVGGLPFIPEIGTMIKIHAEGDYLRINDILLDVSGDGYRLMIGLEQPEDSDLRPFSELSKEGWLAGDGDGEGQ